MKEAMFKIQNRFLMQLGWQACIASALRNQGFVLEDIPPSAMLAFRPIPNKQITVFYVGWTELTDAPELEIPVPKIGKFTNLHEFMAA